MDCLKINSDETFNVVKRVDVVVGDEFVYDTQKLRRNLIVTEVLTQRPEKGIYIDDSNRRQWANVKAENNPNKTKK